MKRVHISFFLRPVTGATECPLDIGVYKSPAADILITETDHRRVRDGACPTFARSIPSLRYRHSTHLPNQQFEMPIVYPMNGW
jgi:hypothetical protein